MPIGPPILMSPYLSAHPSFGMISYMDWLLTVPLLLMELVLVMEFQEDEARSHPPLILMIDSKIVWFIIHPLEGTTHR